MSAPALQITLRSFQATPYKPAPQPPYEMQFWNNHVGHFLFTLKLLPKLLSSASSTHVPRIVNVSSRAHLRSPVIFDDMGFSGGEKCELLFQSCLCVGLGRVDKAY